MNKKIYKERMRQKQKQLRRRRMMKKVTYVGGAVLLLIFVVRGVIFPIINRIGGGSAKTEKPVDVQAEANGEAANAEAGENAENTEKTKGESGAVTMAVRQPLKGSADIEKALELTAGWHEDGTGKWYQNTDGTYLVSGFQKIDGNTYAFDENGYLRTGWYIDGSKEYFFNDDGTYNPEKRRPMLALTYDDGPSDYTSELLDCLEENGAKATFFMLGERIELGYEDEINRMVQLGCELGNHSYNHPNLFEVDLDTAVNQFARTDELLIEKCGQPSTVGRCPFGNGNSEIFNAIGKPFFMWSLDTLDWSLLDADADYNSVMNGDLTDGSIILMHDIHQPSVEASLRIIPELVAKGYRLVTVSELAEAKGVDLEYASYVDFWDSSLKNGQVPGYRGEGWDDISEQGDDFEADTENSESTEDGEDFTEDSEENSEENFEE